MAIDPSVISTDSSGAPTAPAPQPTAPTPPDVSATNGPAPAMPVGQNPNATVPPPPSKNSFGEQFARTLQGPKYQVTGTGETVNATPARINTKGSILGGALAGILQGAVDGMSAPTSGSGKGGAASAGMRNASEMSKERDERARQQAARDFQQKQQATQANVENNLNLARTHDLIQKSQFEVEDHAADLHSRGITDEEHQLQIQNILDQRRQVMADLQQVLISHGVSPHATISQTPVDGKSIAEQAAPHIPSMVQGKSVPVQSGGVGQNNGASLYAKADLDQPIPRGETITVPYFDGTKDVKGNFVSHDRVIQSTGAETYADVARQYLAADAQLDSWMKKDAAAMGAQQKKADLANTQAETGLKKGQTNEANQKAALAAQQTKNLQGGGAKNDDGTWNPASIPVGIVEGTMDPSQLSKRSADYNQKLQAANQYSLEKYGKPFDIAQATIDYKFATNVQTQNTLKYLNSVTPNMQDLVKQSDGIKRTQLPALNDAAAWARLNAGDPKMAAYNATITEVSDQIAKILQGGGTGSGTSDAKLKQAQDLFNKGFTTDQVKAVVDELSKLLDTRKTALIGNNRYLQKQFGVGQTQGGSQGGSQQNGPAQLTPGAAKYLGGQ